LPSTNFTPSTVGTNVFTLTQFGFGKTYSNNTAFYESLLNDDASVFPLPAASQLALNFRGLGLPSSLFMQFNNLLAVITGGESSCLNF